ncbi:hypothetical protein M885DRAFT_590244, partial [Pelagophyceae sp. CCMP2097]
MSRATRQATSRAALGGGTGAERAKQGGTLEEGLEGGAADAGAPGGDAAAAEDERSNDDDTVDDFEAVVVQGLKKKKKASKKKASKKKARLELDGEELPSLADLETQKGSHLAGELKRRKVSANVKSKGKEKVVELAARLDALRHDSKPIMDAAVVQSHLAAIERSDHRIRQAAVRALRRQRHEAAAGLQLPSDEGAARRLDGSGGVNLH